MKHSGTSAAPVRTTNVLQGYTNSVHQIGIVMAMLFVSKSTRYHFPAVLALLIGF